MSLRAVARAANISATYLSQLERDQSKPSEAVVGDIAAAFGIAQDALLAAVGRVAEDLQEIILKQPVETADLLLAIDDFPPGEIVALTARARRRRIELGLEKPKSKI